MDLDTLRTTYPHLGFAIYAYTPGGEVTLECIASEGKTFSFTGPTLADAIAQGFTEDVEPPQPAQPEEPVADAAPDASVFD